jgi:hypothetical protein
MEAAQRRCQVSVAAASLTATINGQTGEEVGTKSSLGSKLL